MLSLVKREIFFYSFGTRPRFLINAFTIERSKAVVLVLFALYVALWLLDVGHFQVLSCSLSYYSGPSCSKLMMTLVNVLLNMAYTLFFC